MLASDLKLPLPSTEELPSSDDTPVDNEDQNLLPNLLLLMLAHHWSDRMDWYFGADMAIYHTTGRNPRIPIVPDGFLSIGVPRKKDGKSRRSYATWEENEIVPILVLEMVSHRYRGEYKEKATIYKKLGVLYYVIYNPEFFSRHKHEAFEVYKLVRGRYVRQKSEPCWMPEIGLGIGRSQQVIGGIEQEILTWYNEDGIAYETPENVMEEMKAQVRLQREQMREQLEQMREQQAALDAEHERAERLAAYLRSQGIDPDNLPGL
ncbi:MAG: hypothetical protein HC860_17580 [Alkalinema sp. RU_4_3]|nr:hypothetical protein [Alkalinema sp. RU_4_3]